MKRPDRIYSMMWAIVNNRGLVCAIHYSRKLTIAEFTSFTGEPWPKSRKRGFHKLIRVQVLPVTTPKKKP